MCISLGIQRKDILIYSKRSMVKQIKQSLISVQINWEPGVKITLLKRIFDSKRVTAGDTESEG